MLPSTESKISLAEARLIVKNIGRDVSFETLWRWARHGLRGGKVKLAYQRIGRQIMTSRPALERFFNELAAADDGDSIDEINPSHDQAEAVLRAAGID